tara:strand:+ start:983 stop:1744 length:762 start_codon:yes stop_codon:yes gene_type:complete
MRIALCLSGIVGRIYDFKAGYTFNKDVDYRIGYHFYKKHIFDVNDTVDVFIQCWDTKYEEEMVDLYKPVVYKFEEPKAFDPFSFRQNNIESRWYATKMVNEMKKTYEEYNNFTYDVVMSSRFDVGFFKDLKFDKIPDMDKNLYIASSNPPNKERITVLDYWYFSNSKNMDIVTNFYHYWKEYGGGSPHRDLYKWPTDNGINVAMLPDFSDSEKGNGNTDLLRAIYDDCEYKGDDFPGVDSLKKLDKYPRGTRF